MEFSAKGPSPLSENLLAITVSQNDESGSAVKPLAANPVKRFFAHLLRYFHTLGHQESVTSIATSDLMDYVISGAEDGTMNVWKFRQENQSYRLAVKASCRKGRSKGKMTVVAMHAFEKIGIAGTSEGALCLIGWQDGRKDGLQIQSKVHEGEILGATFFHHFDITKLHQGVSTGNIEFPVKEGVITKGQRFLQGDIEFQILQTTRKAMTDGRDFTVEMSEFKLLATGGADCKVNILELKGFEPPFSICILRTLDHKTKILKLRDLDPSISQADLASCAEDGVYLWNLSGELVVKLQDPNNECADPLLGMGLTFKSRDLPQDHDKEHKGQAELKVRIVLAYKRHRVLGWCLQDIANMVRDGKLADSSAAPTTPTAAPQPLLSHEFPFRDLKEAAPTADNHLYATISDGEDAAECYKLCRAADGDNVQVFEKIVALKLQTKAKATCLRMTWDPDGSAVLCTGDQNGDVSMWDLDGEDIGERTAFLRSCETFDILLPLALKFMMWLQVTAFAFKHVPWAHAIHSTAATASHALNLNILEFWHVSPHEQMRGKVFVTVGMIIIFLICVLESSTYCMEKISFYFESLRRRKPSHACGDRSISGESRGSTFLTRHMTSVLPPEEPMASRCKHATTRFFLNDQGVAKSPRLLQKLEWLCITLSKLSKLYIKLATSVFMVTVCNNATILVQCEYTEQGLVMVMLPDVHCFQGEHLKLVTMLVTLFPLFLFFAVPYAVVAGDASYVQFEELCSVQAWSKNAKRKACLEYLAPLSPSPENAFASSCMDLLVRVCMSSLSPLLIKKPLLRALACLLISMVWLAQAYFIPAYLDPGFQLVFRNMRIFTVLAMLAATVVVATESSLIPGIGLLVSLIWVGCAFVRNCDTMEATLKKNEFRVMKEYPEEGPPEAMRQHPIEKSLHARLPFMQDPLDSTVAKTEAAEPEVVLKVHPISEH